MRNTRAESSNWSLRLLISRRMPGWCGGSLGRGVPPGRRVALGGVAKRGNTSLAPDAVITEQILQRCNAASPIWRRRRCSASRWESARSAHGVWLPWGCADAPTALALS